MSTPRRVLIIDDEDSIREVAGVSLEVIGGWDVLSAPSGAVGIDTAKAEHPDAILLDVMMPELDGPATLARLRADDATRSTPVILLTAKVQASERERFSQLPIAGLITKPFDPVELPRKVATLLGWDA